MKTPADYEKIIKDQKIYIELLEEEIRYAHGFKKRDRFWPSDIQLTGKEEAVLRVLMSRSIATKETLHQLCFEDAEPKIVDVFIHKLRKAVKIYSENFIDTIWGRGYSLTDEGRKIIEEWKAKAPKLEEPVVPAIEKVRAKHAQLIKTQNHDKQEEQDFDPLEEL